MQFTDFCTDNAIYYVACDSIENFYATDEPDHFNVGDVHEKTHDHISSLTSFVMINDVVVWIEPSGHIFKLFEDQEVDTICSVGRYKGSRKDLRRGVSHHRYVDHGLSNELCEYLSSRHAVICGSHVTGCAQIYLGLQSIDPNDVDVFMVPLEGDIDNLPGSIKSATRVDYYESSLETDAFQLDNQITYNCELADMDWPVQFITHECVSGTEFTKDELIPETLSELIAYSMDFTVAASTLVVLPSQEVILSIRHDYDLRDNVLRLQKDMHTKLSRVAKWQARGFKGNIPAKQIREDTTAVPYRHVCEDRSKFTITDDGDYEFYCCDNITVTCVDCHPKLKFENSSGKIIGSGGFVRSFNSNLTFEVSDSVYVEDFIDVPPAHCLITRHKTPAILGLKRLTEPNCYGFTGETDLHVTMEFA